MCVIKTKSRFGNLHQDEYWFSLILIDNILFSVTKTSFWELSDMLLSISFYTDIQMVYFIKKKIIINKQKKNNEKTHKQSPYLLNCTCNGKSNLLLLSFKRMTVVFISTYANHFWCCELDSRTCRGVVDNM